MHHSGTRGNSYTVTRSNARLRRQKPLGTHISRGTGRELNEQSRQVSQQKSRSPLGFGAPLKRGSRRPVRKRGSRVLTIVGHFPNPWKKIEDEIKNILKRKWNPTVDDFHAVSEKKNVTECKTFHQFLYVIYKNPPGSVLRVNIFTHGSSDSIAFDGSVNARSGEVKLHHNTGLNENSLSSAYGLIFRVRNKRFRLTEVPKAFSKGGQIVFYSCRSGIDLLLLQRIANALKVKVLGFSKYIMYCPKVSENPAKINRKRISLGTCEKPLSDFNQLKPDRQAAPKLATR